MKKIYGFNNGGSPGWYTALALSEDGQVLASHVCSADFYMPHDLGMNGQSDWKHDVYNKALGEGQWQTEFVPRDRISKHEGLQAAIRRANGIAKEDRVHERARMASVTATTEDRDGVPHTYKKTF